MIKPVVNFSFSRSSIQKKQSSRTNFIVPVAFRGNLQLINSARQQVANFQGPFKTALKDFVVTLDSVSTELKSGKNEASVLQAANIELIDRATAIKFIQKLPDRKREILARFTKEGVLSNLSLTEKNDKNLMIRKFEATNSAKGSYDYFAYQYQHILKYDLDGSPMLNKAYAEDSSYTFYGHDGTAVR